MVKIAIYGGEINVYHPYQIEIGNNCFINQGVLLNAKAPIIIEDNVHISPYAIINTGYLDYKKINTERQHKEKEVILKKWCWLGSNCIINPGIQIGENSVVGAGAVVTKNVPDNVIIVDIPAKIKKKIF